MLRVQHTLLAADAKIILTSQCFLNLSLTVVLILFGSVHQFANGWLQGNNAYQAGLGKYFNLEVCH
jgi:hypothetical protein